MNINKMSDFKLTNSELEESYSRYSDEVNSDIENELYSSIHFFKENNLSEVIYAQDLNVNSSSTTGNSANKLISDLNRSKGSSKEFPPSTITTFKNKATPFKSKRDKNISSNLNSKRTISFKSNAFSEKFKNKVNKNESDSSSSSSLYFDEPFEKTDMVTNMEETLDNESLISFVSGESNFSDSEVSQSNSFVGAYNKHDTEIKKRKFSFNGFEPITIDDESSSYSSSEKILSRSLPSKFKKSKSLRRANENSWHIDAEDRLPPRKFMRFFNDAKCGTCGQQGHKAKSCPKGRPRKCYICGDDHLAKQCNRKVCSFCFSFGHHCQKCPRRHNTRIYCEICNLRGHSFTSCPDLWRRFHATTSPGHIIKTPIKSSDFSSNFCYNCGLRGHLGCECLQPNLSYGLSSPWPFVISYDNPNALTDNDHHDNRSSQVKPRMKKRGKKRLKKLKIDKVNPDNFIDSRYFSTKSSFVRKKKKQLFYEEQDFQRTPNNNSEKTDNLSKRKRNRVKRRRRNSGNMLRSETQRSAYTC